jgi:hypothetical protein
MTSIAQRARMNESPTQPAITPRNVISSTDSLLGPPTSPLPGSGPTTPTLLPAPPTYHSNLTPAIYRLKAAYPFLFLTADRQSAFALKGIDRVRLDFNRGTGEFVVTNRSGPRGDQDTEPRALIGGQALASISDGVMKDLIRQLDTECRKNQFLFHRSIFTIDAILSTFAHYQLSPVDMIRLRATALNYHADFQNKFLWKGLLPWCKDFVVDNGRAMELAHQNLMDVAIARELRAILLPQLTKPTYEACWRFVADLLPWERNFMDKSSTQFFYIRLVFTTLTPLIFQLISKEKELNVDTPQGAGLKQDLTMRNTIREVYKDLCYENRFQHVEKEIFKWTEVSAKRRRVADVDRTLEEHIWDDEEAPPPPPGAVARPAVPALFPPSVTTPGGLSSRGQTPDSVFS